MTYRWDNNSIRPIEMDIELKGINYNTKLVSD
jgi:hypothetical protein